MAKFTGTLVVIYDYQDDGTGVYKPVTKSHPIAGDLLQQYVKTDSGEKINDDLSISNRFSILASPSLISFISEGASKPITSMYINYYGVNLKITNIQISPPRVIFTTGPILQNEQN